MRFIRITLIVSIVFTLGCGGGDDGSPPNNNPTEDGTASADIVQVDPNADKWINTPESCAFDPAQEGKADGDHIANFGLKGYIDGVKQDFYLHSTCGDEYKAIWIILATGW
jgi:hypothetical protein